MGIKGKFRGLFRSAGQGWGAFKKGASIVVKDVKSAVATVHQDARDLVGGVGGIIKGGQSIVGNAVNRGADTVSSLGSSLAMPLLLVGGAALLFMLNRPR
jgi:hypothetical protein